MRHRAYNPRMKAALIALALVFAIGSLWLPVNMATRLGTPIVGIGLVLALDRAYKRKS